MNFLKPFIHLGKHAFYFKEGDNSVASTAEAEDFSQVINHFDNVSGNGLKCLGFLTLNPDI